MKNNKPEKINPNMSSLKKLYYVTLENAGKRTQGKQGSKAENNTSPSRYANHTPQVF